MKTRDTNMSTYTYLLNNNCLRYQQASQKRDSLTLAAFNCVTETNSCRNVKEVEDGR